VLTNCVEKKCYLQPKDCRKSDGTAKNYTKPTPSASRGATPGSKRPVESVESRDNKLNERKSFGLGVTTCGVGQSHSTDRSTGVVSRCARGQSRPGHDGGRFSQKLYNNVSTIMTMVWQPASISHMYMTYLAALGKFSSI